MFSVFILIPPTSFHATYNPLVNPVRSVKVYSAPANSIPSSTAWASAKPLQKLLTGVPCRLSTPNQHTLPLAGVVIALSVLVFSPATVQIHSLLHSHSWLTLPVCSGPSSVLDIFAFSAATQCVLDTMVTVGCLNQASFLLPMELC